MKDTVFPYKIRWARKEDWEPAMAMVWKTFLTFEGNEYSEEGVRSFRELISGKQIHEAFLRGEYQMMVALDGSRIIGAVSVKCGNLLSLLFVDEEYHKQGVGRELMRKLIKYLREEAGERYVSLKSSPYAVNFYRKMGFRAVRPEEEHSGIRVTSMEKFF